MMDYASKNGIEFFDNCVFFLLKCDRGFYWSDSWFSCR